MNVLLMLILVLAIILIFSIWFLRSKQSQQEQTILTKIKVSITDTGKLSTYTCIHENTLKKLIDDYNSLKTQIVLLSQSVLSNKTVINELTTLSTQYKNTIDDVSKLPLCDTTCVGGNYRDDTCICPEGTYQKVEGSYIYCSKDCIVSSTGTLLKDCSATCGTGLQTWIKDVDRKEENGGTCPSDDERTYLTTCMITPCKEEWSSYNTGDSHGYAVCTDSENNVYIAGEYCNQPLNIYNSDNILKSTLENIGGCDCFLIKYDELGNVLWSTRVGGTNNDTGYSITNDTLNNVYITGRNYNPITIYNKDGSIFGTLPCNRYSVFIIKYNDSGNVVWATYMSGNVLQSGSSLVCDSENNLYVAARYTASTLTIHSVNTSITTLENSGDYDGVIVKFNKDGNTIWTTRIAGITNQVAYTVAVDTFNNVYIGGAYVSLVGYSNNIYNSDGTIFDTLPITINISSNRNGFIVKYDKNGNGICYTYFTSNNFTVPITLCAKHGCVYLTGMYYSSLKLYNQNGSIFKTLENEGDNDCFVAKYDQDLNGIWATRISGTMYDTGFYITSDVNRDVYISGYFTSNTVTIYNQDGTPFTTLTNQGNTNSFIVKYNENGYCIYYYQFGGDSSHVSGLAVDNKNNLYIVGDYRSSSPFTVYNKDGYIVKNLPATESTRMNSFLVNYFG